MSRTLQQRLLLLVGAVALSAAVIATYARDVLADSTEFAERTAVAFEQPEVRVELTAAIVDEMVDRAPELIAVQPLLITVVDGVLATETARSLLRVAVADLHRTLFTDDDDTIILGVSELILVAKAQVTALDPELGALIPDDLTDSVIEARERSTSIDIAQFVEQLDAWIWLLVAAAVVAFVAALWRVPDASSGLIGIGLALIAAALLTIAAAIVGRWWFVGGSEPARVAVWEAFVDPLDTWVLTIGGLGAMLAAIAWYGVGDVDLDDRLRRLAQLARRRSSRPGRVLWGLAAIALGMLVVANAASLLRLAVITLGVFVVVTGGREVALSVFPTLERGVSERRERGRSDPGPARDRRGRLAATVLVVAMAVTGGIVVATSDGESPTPVTDGDGCNGSEELCDRRLDEVTLAATHNSNAAAGAGFLNGYQTFGIGQQLTDGIRGLLIDVYFGFDDGGRVITDRAPLSPDERDELVADVGEAAVNAAESTRASFQAAGVEKEMFLCHALCEIGASRFVDELTTIRRFLDEHPREVLVIIIQDEGPLPADIEDAFEQSGLIDVVHAQDPDEPFPTLGEMIDRGERVFVGAENRAGDELDWYHDAFTFVQDTEFTYDSIDDFECARNRGGPGSPLLLVNHWVSPVSLRRSEEANQTDVLRARFDECVAERGMIPNLIAVDFYERGDLLDFVAALG